MFPFHRRPFLVLAPGALLLGFAGHSTARHVPPDPSEPRFTNDSTVGVPVGLLPEPVTSFGAAVKDGYAYVLGGYTGPPHDYRTRFQSRSFWRLNLADPSSIELLPNEERLQSVALVVDGEHLVRVGGMTIEDDETRSTAECARFSPADEEWSAFPALPRPRSSHDAITIGRTLFVAGGWELSDEGKPHWFDEALAIDLDDPSAGWRSLPQPFRRRALAAADAGGKLVVLGGMTDAGEISSRVDVYDPADGSWSTGPDFPGSGFGMAAIGIEGRVIASGMDGAVHSWRPGDAAWQPVGTLVFPRFFHRFVPASADSVLALGGIGRDTRPRHVERLALSPPAPRDAEVVRFTVATSDPTPGRAGAFLRGHELHLFGRQGVRVDLRTLAVSSVAAPARSRAKLRTIVSDGGRDAWGIRDGGTVAQSFDFEAGTWSDALTLAAPFGTCAWVLDGRELWAFGGTDAEGAPVRAIRRASTVQLDQGFEEVEARLPRPRAECAAAVLDGAAWFVGGRTEGGALCREVDVMDLGTGTWRTASAPPTPRVGASLVPLGGALVLVGGQEPDASGDLVPATSAWRYAPAEDAWSEFLAPQAFSSDVVHAFAYRGHLLLATPTAHEGAVDLLLVRPPVSRPALEVRATPPAPGDRWPSFRGGAFGRTAAEGLPTTWSDDAGVAWTTTVPGTGQSSPVVLGDRVYVTSVDGAEKEHAIVTCLDAQDGTIRWSKKLDASTRVPLTDMVSQAAPTPAVEDARVYAFFESGDLVALDSEGEVLWRRALSVEYGAYVGNHGLGSSLVLTDAGVVVLVDHDGPSYLLCVDRETGENVWKVERSSRISWTSPVVASGPEGDEVVVSSAGSVDAYDAATGARRWTLTDVAGNTVPSPTVLGDLVVVGASSGDGNLAFARPSGDDLTPRLVWRARRTIDCGFSSPLVLDRHVLLVNETGVLSCLSRDSGDLLWKHRLPSQTWATPIAKGSRVHLFGIDGDTTILEIEDEAPRVLAENRLTPHGRVVGVAATDGTFFVREPTRVRCVRG